MKRIKRIASLALAMVMVFAMSVTAFAGSVGDPGDTPPEDTDTYEIYQIFTGTYADGTLSDIKWGVNGSQYSSGEVVSVSQEILTELQELDEKTDAEKVATIQKYVNFESNPVKSGDETQYSVDAGYYLIKSTKPVNADENSNGAYTLYVVKVTNGDLTFSPKVDVPEVEKKIVDDSITPGGKGTVNEASIGDEVSYEITATLPTERFDDYETYYLKLVDTLSAGLDYKSTDGLFVVNGEEEKLIDASSYGITPDGKTITVEILDAKEITGVTQGSKIVWRYKATLNKDAVVGGDGNPNTVKLVYSNDPNHSGKGTPGTEEHPTGETPDKKVVTYTTQITITKVIGDTTQILSGAGFTLIGDGVNVGLVSEEVYKESLDGTYYRLKNGTYTSQQPTEETKDDYEGDGDVRYEKVIEFKPAEGNVLQSSEIFGMVDSTTGTLTFKGLGAGDYTLRETVTPAGYNTMQEKKFTIGFDYKNSKFTITNVAASGEVGDSGLKFGEPDSEGKVVGLEFATNIGNFKGATLPSTGGIGTTIFYVVGGILVIGAGILLVTKRRMKAQ